MDIVRRVVPTGTRAPTGDTNAYVLGTGPTVLVDPATRTDALDDVVAARSVEHVLVTHSHPDHVGAVARYAAETGATVWARAGHADRFRETTDCDPDREFGPGTEITLGDDRVRVLDAPGHAPDHVALEAGREGPILCGDCALREGSVVVGAPEGDMRAYLTTLRRLWAIDPPRLCPGHGPEITSPRETLERLLDHRYRRERRINEAVSGGARTLEEILASAYEKDLAGVQDLARATVVAHLEKLDVEGRLEWDGERVRPTTGKRQLL
ncbi:MBL fold metallo-hydrolase [Natronobacterium gregoryi]|uniref:Beta-lactamase n=2 Tax=Natronobacterium gregoryi TaxID=44930 RepID=L0AG27_NATGS|nr:MBL fold metallo-hydrolase [Natronobacterium gregoryi]AFZ72025.1 Zn-dependent hydrolase, glyoxylase [Natronobacterium gregoryi SP2]ELY62701.1 beta-lactamase [Natronobacterium gregoryi SP2]PLK20873.1 MBL fold hydrolase [Natronobacterium gregoryi SP2]SFJ20213.1 Glyoxylase, beta-lactamase superfamily II [Natronobacterium gregoryi]